MIEVKNYYDDLFGLSLYDNGSLNYQTCKSFFLRHPMGKKVAQSPLTMALTKKRNITVKDAVGSAVVDEFNAVWERLRIDEKILNLATLSRVYGVASVAVMDGNDANSIFEPLDKALLYQRAIDFNIYDPLNTSGSFVSNQNPLSVNFLKSPELKIAGRVVNRARACVLVNDTNIYLTYNSSGFGYIGRSIYEAGFECLLDYLSLQKSRRQIIDKAGVVIHKKGSHQRVDGVVAKILGRERALIDKAQTGGVLTISGEDDLSEFTLKDAGPTIDLLRRQIIEDIANSTNMPSKLLLQDGYAGLLSNGTEDFKQTIIYIDFIRNWLKPVYDFFDDLVQHIAWTPEFIASQVKAYPKSYDGQPIEWIFNQRWRRSFQATNAPLIDEPKSDAIAIDKSKIEAILAITDKLWSVSNDLNKKNIVDWLVSQVNECDNLFTNALDFDAEGILFTDSDGT